jgi:hypothetical protein
MADEIERVRRALEGIVRADEDLRIAAERHRELSVETARRLETGTEQLTDILVDLHAADRRQEMNDAIEGFESARQAVRLAFFALGRTQGATPTSVGRALGISRQLASRLANLSDEADSS